MLKPLKMANAATIVTVICHVIYLIVLAITPRVIHQYVASMSPGYDLSGIETSDPMGPGLVVLGVIMTGLTVWVLVFVIVWLYNKMEK